MEAVGWETGRGGRAADVFRPALRAARVDVPLGDVGHPEGEGGAIVGAPDAVPQPGVRRTAVTGEPGRLEAPFPGEGGEFALEQRPVREPVQQDGVARCVVQLLGQGSQRCDADTGRDECDLLPGAGPGGQPAVRRRRALPGRPPG